MIGKTGNGKSSLGNFILRRNAFESRSSATSVTTGVSYDFSEFYGRTIKVVDGPGVGDTRLKNEHAATRVIEAMQYAISANPRGYHAFLLVVKFGGRFTSEDGDTIEFLKKVFGKGFVKRYCILVMAYGDNFEKESRETGQTFQQWCDEQGGVFRELLAECGERIILMDNKTKDGVKINQQISDLVDKVDRLTSNGHRYTDEHFKNAKAARDALILDVRRPMIQEEAMRETSLILFKLKNIQLTVEPEDMKPQLDELFNRAELLHESICAQDKGSGALPDLMETVSTLRRQIVSEIDFSRTITVEKDRMKNEQEKRERMFNEEMARQKEDYERSIMALKLEDEHRGRMRREEEKLLNDIEKRRKVAKDVERRFFEELMKEWERRDKELEELEKKCREAKAKNQEGILSEIISGITWALKTLLGFK
ncbi:unnamed protein product [Lymnaea stagnalis]|uniref:AIG1-type G domain-containing protein n=1 Tax=Lymnaea stagnalis TaxID=6523 RepID=A0AAV2IN94_LYMST